ncbi:hypothetical protein EGK76_02300 [Luteimonas sp. 100069]|nr:hypothetical protein EGK76_02300 [Luteimonas sp. 100069]
MSASAEAAPAQALDDEPLHLLPIPPRPPRQPDWPARIATGRPSGALTGMTGGRLTADAAARFSRTIVTALASILVAQRLMVAAPAWTRRGSEVA